MIYIATRTDSRKSRNIQRDARCCVVVDWKAEEASLLDDPGSVGLADHEPTRAVGGYLQISRQTSGGQFPGQGGQFPGQGVQFFGQGVHSCVHSGHWWPPFWPFCPVEPPLAQPNKLEKSPLGGFGGVSLVLQVGATPLGCSGRR